MITSKDKDKIKDQNLMELIPIRNFEHNIKEDGLIDVLVPRFRDKFFGKLLQPKMKNKYIRANLDKIGSFVWLQINGTNTVYDISMLSKEHFGEDLKEHNSRTALFVSQLFRNGFINFKE